MIDLVLILYSADISYYTHARDLSIDTMFCYALFYNALAPLQALSKRIHYGKFVAEAKFQECPSVYEAAIKVKVRIYFSYKILPPF
jgi:hypothetical protein